MLCIFFHAQHRRSWISGLFWKTKRNCFEILACGWFKNNPGFFLSLFFLFNIQGLKWLVFCFFERLNKGQPVSPLRYTRRRDNHPRQVGWIGNCPALNTSPTIDLKWQLRTWGREVTQSFVLTNAPHVWGQAWLCSSLSVHPRLLRTSWGYTLALPSPCSLTVTTCLGHSLPGQSYMYQGSYFVLCEC